MFYHVLFNFTVTAGSRLKAPFLCRVASETQRQLTTGRLG